MTLPPSRVPGGGLLISLLTLLLAGCSGTPFGEALSGSFSAAPATPSSPAAPSSATAPTSSTAPSSPASTAAKPLRPAPGSPGTGVTRPGAAGSPGGTRPASPTAAPRSSLSAAGSAPSAAPGRSLPFRPASYRVTILLPQADASAPAEGLTQALRSAGVPFEVETIERTGSGAAGGSSSTAVPAAPGPATAAPTVRPAPPPR